MSPLVSVRWLAIYALAFSNSAMSLPRSRAIIAGSFNASSPWQVARTTLWALADPSDLVTMLPMPAASTTARTAPPAMMPVPSGAGFSSTLPAPNRPTIRCGIVVPAIGTRIRFFFAASMPFLMAEGTSFALPMPKPTTPWPSPTTTSALKLRFLPPLTTLVTRLIDTTLSLMSSCDGSIRSRVRILLLEFQSRFARSVGHGADPPVVQEPAAVEYHALDALLDRALGDRLADRLRTLQIAAAPRLVERTLDGRLDGRGRHQRFAAEVVDHLRVDVRHAAEHAQTRPLLGPGDPLALPQLDPDAPVVLGLDSHRLSPLPSALSPTWRRSFRLSSSRPHRCTVRPSACTGRACAAAGCWPR